MVNINCAAELFKFDSSTLNYYKNINKIQKKLQFNEYISFKPSFRVVKKKQVQPQKLKGVYDVSGMLHCYSCDAWFEDTRDEKLFHLAHHVTWTLNLADLEREELRYRVLRKKYDLKWLIENE